MATYSFSLLNKRYIDNWKAEQILLNQIKMETTPSLFLQDRLKYIAYKEAPKRYKLENKQKHLAQVK